MFKLVKAFLKLISKQVNLALQDLKDRPPPVLAHDWLSRVSKKLESFVFV